MSVLALAGWLVALLVLGLAALVALIIAFIHDETLRDLAKLRRHNDKLRHERDGYYAQLYTAQKSIRDLKRQLDNAPKPYAGGGWGRTSQDGVK